MSKLKRMHKILQFFQLQSRQGGLNVVESVEEVQRAFPKTKDVQGYLNELAKREYLERVPNPSDDGSKYLVDKWFYTLTEKGNAALFNEELLESHVKSQREKIIEWGKVIAAFAAFFGLIAALKTIFHF